MKIRFTKKTTVKTPFGRHTFTAGELVSLDHMDAYSLIKNGFAIPHHPLIISRVLAQMSPEDVSLLNEAVALFDGHIIDIKKKRKPLDVSKCKLSPAPWGTCKQFDMKIGPDYTLWAYCIRGRRFCPNSSAQKGKEVIHETFL